MEPNNVIPQTPAPNPAPAPAQPAPAPQMPQSFIPPQPSVPPTPVPPPPKPPVMQAPPPPPQAPQPSSGGSSWGTFFTILVGMIVIGAALCAGIWYGRSQAPAPAPEEGSMQGIAVGEPNPAAPVATSTATTTDAVATTTASTTPAN